MKLMTMAPMWTLVLVTLPCLASCFPQKIPSWKDQVVWVHSHLHGYVCCNQPATPAGPKMGRRHRGYLLTKRGDEYSDMRRTLLRLIRRFTDQSADRGDDSLVVSSLPPSSDHSNAISDHSKYTISDPSNAISDHSNAISDLFDDWEPEESDVESMSGLTKRFSREDNKLSTLLSSVVRHAASLPTLMTSSASSSSHSQHRHTS